VLLENVDKLWLVTFGTCWQRGEIGSAAVVNQSHLIL